MLDAAAYEYHIEEIDEMTRPMKTRAAYQQRGALLYALRYRSFAGMIAAFAAAVTLTPLLLAPHADAATMPRYAAAVSVITLRHVYAIRHVAFQMFCQNEYR